MRYLSPSACVISVDDYPLHMITYQFGGAAHATDTNIEIVLIGADSIDTIHRTHGHYFSTDDAVERYLTTA